MEEIRAKELVEAQGYVVQSISYIPEGTGHYGFDINLENGKSVIARFENEHRISPDGKRRDFCYNGILSLERESALCSMVKHSMGLPAPEVIALHQTETDPFLLVEKLPGKHWKEFIEDNNYSLSNYLQSLEFLGSDIAQFQRFHFESYGDIISERHISPRHIQNLDIRLGMIIDLKLKRAGQAQVLNGNEFEKVKRFFYRHINELKGLLSNKNRIPVFIVADIHPMNFFVVEDGKPSGYFDLEFCQAGDPSLEMYLIKLQLFNYFNEAIFQQAQDSFYQGYYKNGGLYERDNQINQKLEMLLSVGHIFSAITSYYGVHDGLRDSWSRHFKDILFKTIKSGEVDYIGFGDVVRSKTKQPSNPTLP